MKALPRRAFGRFLLGVASAGLSACKKERARETAGVPRVVSLSPSLTETLFAIGAGAEVVGVSDYCESPEPVKKLPRLGTSITPNYEAIASVAPTLIVSEKNASTRRKELEALAPTALFDWLSVAEVVASTRALGTLTGHAREANALAERLHEVLSVPEPSDGPRVLVLLGGADSGPSSQLWFVRKNSLHGAALHAAGARNAVAEDVLGPPELGYERLLTLDPEAILILAHPTGTPGASVLRALSQLKTLRAVREQKLEVVALPEAFSNGPSILLVVAALHASLDKLFRARGE